MGTKYIKETDYILTAVTLSKRKVEGDYEEEALLIESELTRRFNFAASTVMTLATERMYQFPNGGDRSSCAVSTQMSTEKFADMADTREIELMFEELKKQKGNPPELSFKTDKAPRPGLRPSA